MDSRHFRIGDGGRSSTQAKMTLSNSAIDDLAYRRASNVVVESWPPDSCPWDTAYYEFGRWLWRGLPHNTSAVVSTTNCADRIAKCREDYVEFVHYTRDDWVGAADGFDTPDCGNHAMNRSRGSRATFDWTTNFRDSVITAVRRKVEVHGSLIEVPVRLV